MSYRRRLVMALGKVVIAAAWSDHHLSTDEINSLKQLLLRIPIGTGNEGQLTAKEAAELDIYLHSPVSETERAALIADLRDLIVNPSDKQAALTLLDEMIRADGVITPEEREMSAEVQRALDDVGSGLLGRLGRLFGWGGARREKDGPERREELVDEYLTNRVYFALRRRIQTGEISPPEGDDATLRLACLAAGVLANTLPPDLSDELRIADTLISDWQLNESSARLVAEAARSEAEHLDTFKLQDSFRNAASREQRLHLLASLFRLAITEGTIDSANNTAISAVIGAIGLTSSDFAIVREQVVGRQ